MSILHRPFAIVMLGTAVFGVLLAALSASHTILMRQEPCSAVLDQTVDRCQRAPEHAFHAVGQLFGAVGDVALTPLVPDPAAGIAGLALVASLAAPLLLQPLTTGPPRQLLKWLCQFRALLTLAIDVVLRAWRAVLELAGPRLVA